MTQTVLILGAKGRFGRHASEAFGRAGWKVRPFTRGTDSLEQASCSVDVIVNGWNPPYPKWASQVPELHARVIEAARATGATVIVPGNVYVFGAQTAAPWSEHSPHRAQNPLGSVRVEMEAAYRRSGIRVILLRAGDFLDVTASGNWFDAVMTRKLCKGVLTYPGIGDALHSWAFLPDLARAAVQLAEMRQKLDLFNDIPFPGCTLSGLEMAAILDRLAPNGCSLRPMSWLPLQIAKPFWPMARNLLEMRYLWNTPHSLEGSAFRKLLPEFQETPVDKALRAAIAHLNPESDRPRQDDDGLLGERPRVQVGL